MTDLIIRLPFDGFYESIWSGELDHVEEMETEHLEERQEEEGIDPALRLDASDFASILFDVADYSAMHASAAHAIADGTVAWFDDALGFKTGMTFESMTSPREYNFETDRLFANVSPATVQALFAQSETDGHARLSALIKERFTSYDGFFSSYDNDVAEWLAKPVLEWDHNELGTLLEAVAGWTDEARWEIHNDIPDGFYNEFGNAIDWAKLDELVAEKRAEKAAA